MNKIDLWHLCDEISVVDASLLIIGIDPADQTKSPESMPKPPEGYEAISTAIKNNVLSQKIPATISYFEDFGGGESQISWTGTRLEVEHLKKWLRQKNFTNNFFFENETTSTQSYLDPNHECYAPKLSAAVNAWIEVTSNPESLNGKTPKQALDKWLRQNANNYGLTKEDGNPNESAIEEISKIANWRLEGGVAKTNTRVQSKPTKGSNKPTPDIPF